MTASWQYKVTTDANIFVLEKVEFAHALLSSADVLNLYWHPTLLS